MQAALQGAATCQLCRKAAVWRWEELQAGVVTVAPFSCTLSSSKSFYNPEPVSPDTPPGPGTPAPELDPSPKDLGNQNHETK